MSDPERTGTSRRFTTRLTVAIAAAFAGNAFALNVQPDGIGQVLLYPYYTVEKDQATLVSVVNNSARVKAVKVRFHEARNGSPALEFNLYLSPFDTWTAAVSSTAGSRGAPVLSVADRSCTVPAADALVFSNASYTGTNRDFPTSGSVWGTLERTREGFIELIEMGELQPGTGPAQLAEEVTQGANGVPVNCATVVNAWDTGGAWAANAADSIDLPAGGLYGTGAIVDVAAGTMMSYDATALTRFYTNTAVPGALNRAPDAGLPNLASADNGDGQITIDLPSDDRREAVAKVLPAGSALPDAVSLALIRHSVLGEFSTEPAISAATEWVITMPTKRFYTNVVSSADVFLPFTNPFRDDAKSCDFIGRSFSSREAQPGVEPIPDFHPGPSPDLSWVSRLCYAANVVTFNQDAIQNGTGNSAVLGSTHATNVIVRGPTLTSIFHTGHATLLFDSPLTAASDYYMVFHDDADWPVGLPVIAFGVTRAVNGNAQPGILAAYAGATRLRTFVRYRPNPH
jgi:hypothetical protein